MLKADIQKNDAKAKLLTKEIAGLDEDISVWNGDVKAATKVREIEKADYDATHTDYSESISALERAIAVLKKQAHDRKQASLIQLKKLRLIPDDAKRAIDAFLQQDPDEGLAVSAPEANAYEFQSGGVVEMLEKLLDKFIEERTTLEKEEMNSKHAYDMLMQDLNAQVSQATTDRGEKAEFKAETLQSKADAKGDLQDTTSTRDEDEKYLADLTAQCEAKSSAFANRQQLRAEEIEAVEKAIEILSSGEVSGASEKHLPQFMQIKKTSLVQLRSANQNPNQMKVAAYLKSQASKFNSKVLTALAVRVESDPFKKVTKMIKDLIVKLMEEAAAESEHKGLCDSELATNEQTRKEKTEAIETLHAEIDSLEAAIAKLTRHIKELNTAVSELDAAVAKATEVRQTEKAKNTETIKDSQDAQTAVEQALAVLKEFYDKAATATALVQEPEIFDEPYKGMGGENGGVVGMIEVIQSDFARLESETSAGEADAQKEYDGFMADSKADKEQKNADIDSKTSKKASDTQALEEKKSDLAGTQKELDAALEYYEKLKPQCIDQGVSYEDRVAQRKEEIESLKEALSILEGEAVF